MGLSFVSKVSPVRFQGLMQGGWLLATATGNKLLFVGGYFWDKIELWQLWAIFVVCCLLSAVFIFSIMRRLESATGQVASPPAPGEGGAGRWPLAGVVFDGRLGGGRGAAKSHWREERPALSPRWARRAYSRDIAPRPRRTRAWGAGAAMGDDAAVLRRVAPAAVLTTDLLIEGIDFDFAWATPTDVGCKAAAVDLSDLAAMGATPRCLLLSLGLRREDRVADALAIVRAFARGRPRERARVGGDLSRTVGPLVVSVTAVGEVPPRRALLRRRGKPGRRHPGERDPWEPRPPGCSCCSPDSACPRALARRLLRPRAAARVGARAVALGRRQELRRHLGRPRLHVLHVVAPGCTARIDVTCLPVDRAVAAVAARLRKPAWEMALSGGEDFELVLAVPPAKVAAALRLARRVGVPLTPVGNVVAGERLELLWRAGGRGERLRPLPNHSLTSHLLWRRIQPCLAFCASSSP